MFIYFSCYFDIDQGHSSSKQIEKENKPRRKVIGLDNAIKDHFKWYTDFTDFLGYRFLGSGLKKGVEIKYFGLK